MLVDQKGKPRKVSITSLLIILDLHTEEHADEDKPVEGLAVIDTREDARLR